VRFSCSDFLGFSTTGVSPWVSIRQPPKRGHTTRVTEGSVRDRKEKNCLLGSAKMLSKLLFNKISVSASNELITFDGALL
jgi:hypothetical protein